MNIFPIFPQIIAIDFIKNVDIKLIEKYCYDLYKTDKSSVISNRGENSYQSPSLNLKFEVNDEMIKLLKEIENKLSEVSNTIGFNSKIKITNYWANINRKHCYNVDHVHQGSLLSAVFYVKVPENSGKITFLNPNDLLMESYLHGKNLNLNYDLIHCALSSTFTVEPKENCAIIFPSWLTHRVEHNNSDEDRISISFNSIN
jgi:uncharacterized protein (TIGR02466 family)